MEEWTDPRDINIFSEYDYETNSNDSEKIYLKRKYAETNINIPQKNCQSNDSVLSKESKESVTTATTEKERSVWSIEDDTFFYPLGICNHSIAGASKSVIVTWSEYSVINFVIKKVINKKQTKTTRVRINVPEDEIIKNVQILEFNTLLLLESGKVNYFSSAKSMHSLCWLDGVRCIGSTLHGFCIIRLASNQKLLLEVYEDAVNMGKKNSGSLRQQFDITFDDLNLFNCNWEDEKFFISAVAIDSESVEFMEHLTANTCDLRDQEEIFIFSVSGKVFVLVPRKVKYQYASNNETYHIETIFNYASNVNLIKVDQHRKFCLIFLECGSVDIWYTSSATNILLHQLHNTGTVFVNFTYADSRSSFFFTDESQLVQLNFIYNAIQDRFYVKETYKAISGILACTWIETIEQLVCLDCNNIFHQISFEELTSAQDNENDMNSTFKNDTFTPSTSVDDYEKFNILFELTPKRISQLIEKANIIQQLKNLPKELHNAIEKEYVKQHLLAIDEKRNYYSKQILAKLKLSKQLNTAFESDSLTLYASVRDIYENNVIAHIELDIVHNDIFRSSVWHLHANCGNIVHVFSLPYPLQQSKIRLVMQWKRRNQELMPKIQLNLYTFISHETDHIPLSLPIRFIETYETYLGLFAPSFRNAKQIFSTYNLNDLLARFKSQTVQKDLPDFQHFLILPKNIDVKAIKKLFKVVTKDQLNNELECFDIFFLNCNISVSSENSKEILHLKSNDAAALYYFKIYIMLACDEWLTSKNRYQSSDYQQMLLRHQCSIENCYGSFLESDISDASGVVLRKQRYEILKQIYEKIRKHLNNK